MKKINIIKKSDEFSSIIKKRNGVANKYFILNIENNDSNIPKFGITFVKHIGKAVTRNKLKRRTKSIIDNNKNNDYQVYFMYDTFFGGTDGIKLYKKRHQFKPYKVKWKYIDER